MAVVVKKNSRVAEDKKDGIRGRSCARLGHYQEKLNVPINQQSTTNGSKRGTINVGCEGRWKRNLVDVELSRKTE